MSIGEQSRTARDSLLQAAVDELVEKGHSAVSLRAVARRAGVSHAAPAHFFGDRAGMLTAVATDGFHRLTAALVEASSRPQESPEDGFGALGLAYLEFGLAYPALSDLMYRRADINPDDPGFVDAQQAALGLLRDAVDSVVDDHADEWSLLSWAVVHGLVSLVREEVLSRAVEIDQHGAGELARRLVALYAKGVAAATRAP